MSSHTDLYPQFGVAYESCATVCDSPSAVKTQFRDTTVQAVATVKTRVCPAYPSSIRFKPVTAATTARYFARALQKGGDYATQTSQLIQRHHRGTI